MGVIGEYLMGVAAAAVICAAVKRLGAKGTLAAALRLATGAFLALAVLRPWVQLQWDGWQDLTADVLLEGEALAEEGRLDGEKAVREVITRQTEAYILDKAAALGATVTVSVTLDDRNCPCGVTVTGPLSPAARGSLSDAIDGMLGISKEAQIWKS